MTFFISLIKLADLNLLTFLVKEDQYDMRPRKEKPTVAWGVT